ncbi:uncharacterized protein [Anabrus simplex]|uniref:uncharacterized protein n=1 Tax=Anabrus simplex TaxID=316456 RepID=UPI0035A373B4
MDDSAPEDDETLSDVPPIQSSEEEGQEGETLMDFLGAGFLSGVEERIDQGPGTAPSNKQPGEVSGQHPPAEAVDSIGDSLMNQRLQKPAEPVSSAEGISEGPQGVLDEDMKEQKTWGLADISRIPITDSAVLAELKIADEQAKNTSVLITKMKESIAQYQNANEVYYTSVVMSIFST